MAKKDKDEMAAQGMPQTMEDYLLSQLEAQGMPQTFERSR